MAPNEHAEADNDSTSPPLENSAKFTQCPLPSSPSLDATRVLRSDGSNIKPTTTLQSPEVSAPVSAADMARQASVALWSKFQPKAMEHFTVLETAIASLEQTILAELPDCLLEQCIDGLDHDVPHPPALLPPYRLDESSRFEGERAAHKLVGTLGMFGKPEGSVLARQIETLLQQLHPPSVLQREIVPSVMLQLMHKVNALRPLLVTEEIVAEKAGCDAEINEETELLSYDQACRDLTKYLCLARRHHHAIALAWVSFIPDNALALHSLKGTHEERSCTLSEETPIFNTTLDPLLKSWAVSIQHYFRTEDIVTQSASNRVLFVFYACTKQDALTRLNPLIHQLLKQIQKRNKKESRLDSGIEKSSYASLIQSSPNLSLNIAEFPNDGNTLNELEAIALESNVYAETFQPQDAQIHL